MKMKHALLMAALSLGAWGTVRAEEAKPAPTKPEAAYPLETCVVSGEKLGEMGKPYELDYKGQKVLFCCKDCVKKFNKDPEKYLAKIAEAAKAKDAPKAEAPK